MRHTDFKTIRNFVRFAGMGVLPSRERAEAVLEVINASDSTDDLQRVREIAETVLTSVLPQQEQCLSASSDIDRLIAKAEAEQDRAAPGAGRG